MNFAVRILFGAAFASFLLGNVAVAQDPLNSIRPAPLPPGGRAPAQMRPATPAAAVPDKSGDATSTDPDVPSLDDLTATRERPLFSSTRRPPDVEPVQQVAAPISDATSMPFELVGIVVGSDVNAAIFRNTDTKEETRVAKGDKVGNWSVEEITGRAVVLRGPDKRVRMRLFNESVAPGIQVGKASGEPDPDLEPAPAEGDQEKVDEDIAPATSPQVKPATAQVKPPPSLTKGATKRPRRLPRNAQQRNRGEQ